MGRRVNEDLESSQRRFFQLPVYRKGTELFNAFCQNTMKMPRWAQERLADPVKEMICDVLVFVGKADTVERDRGELLVRCLGIVEEMKYRIRVLRDLGTSKNKYLTEEGFGNIARPLEEMRRQLAGWARSCGEDADSLPRTAGIYTVREYEKFFVGRPTAKEREYLSILGMDDLPEGN